MPRCARSSTSLVWGIPVHPTHLLRAVKTHQRLLPIMRALRGCHAFAPNPPQKGFYPSTPSFDVEKSSALNAASARDILSCHENFVAQKQVAEEPSITVTVEGLQPVVEDIKFSVVSPTINSRRRSGGKRKGISSIPFEILKLIETEVILSAHEEDVPRTLVDAIDEILISEGNQPHFNTPSWKRICVCGERYEETLDVMRCREKVMASVGGRETQKYLLRHFGLTTAVISTPLKHSIVLLILPSNVSSFPARLTSIPALPMHPPISRQVLSSYPHETPELTGGRLPLSKTHRRRASPRPPVIPPLITPSDEFFGHLHPGMFSQAHWRLRNQNSGIRASLVNPDYTFLTDEMVRRIRRCVEGMVLWKAVRIAREELGYEDLACIKHFNMRLLSDRKRVNNETSEETSNDACQSDISEGEAQPNSREDFERKIETSMKERERNYWSVAIRPSLWLLEELIYEP